MSDFKSYNPDLTEEQIQESKVFELPLPTEAQDCGLVWVRDSGAYSIWKATRIVTIWIDQTRKGKYIGSVSVFMRPEDTIKIMMNLDGQNYDGYRC